MAAWKRGLSSQADFAPYLLALVGSIVNLQNSITTD
jgi:hypothetical protein